MLLLSSTCINTNDIYIVNSMCYLDTFSYKVSCLGSGLVLNLSMLSVFHSYHHAVRRNAEVVCQSCPELPSQGPAHTGTPEWGCVSASRRDARDIAQSDLPEIKKHLEKKMLFHMHLPFTLRSA